METTIEGTTVETENTRTYFRHCPENYKGERITIAGLYSNGKLKIGVSRCSNKDQFDKKKGRLVSLGRAEKCPLYEVDTNTPKKSFTEIFQTLEKDFMDKSKRNEFLTLLNQNPSEKVERKLGFKEKAKNFIKQLF